MPRPWGWKVSAYLWTKSIAAGLPLASVFADGGTFRTLAAPVLSLVFLALTTALLIADLKRPDRFHYILLKPNTGSWLVWGAWILIAFGAVGGAGLVTMLAGTAGPDWLGAAWIALGLATAAYSAWLFGQATGREFWRSPLKALHLVVTAIAAGSAILLTTLPLAIALVAHGVLVMAELLGRHRGRDAALAARLLTRGPLRLRLWGGVMAAGVVLPIAAALAAIVGDSVLLAVVAALLALGGLWLWEDLWVRAGQAMPLS